MQIDTFPANVIERLTFLTSAVVNCHHLNSKWKQSLSHWHFKKKKNHIKSHLPAATEIQSHKQNLKTKQIWESAPNCRV